jgi:hypothetical protein
MTLRLTGEKGKFDKYKFYEKTIRLKFHQKVH